MELGGIEFSTQKSSIVQILHHPDMVAIEQRIGTGVGRSTNLTCESEANPPAKYSWVKNRGNVKISDSSKYEVLSGSNKTVLKVHNVIIPDDLGNYTCTAENKIGKGSATINVYGQTQKIQRQITAEILDSSNTKFKIIADVGWKQNITRRKMKFKRAGEISWFEKTYKINERNILKKVASENSGTIFTIEFSMDFLFINTKFEVMISIENQFGWSDPSEKFYIHTAYVCGTNANSTKNWQVLISHAEFGSTNYRIEGRCTSVIRSKRHLSPDLEIQFTDFDLAPNSDDRKCNGYNINSVMVQYGIGEKRYFCEGSNAPTLGRVMRFKGYFFQRYTILLNQRSNSRTGRGFRLKFREKK